MIILAIETSCDETSVAFLQNRKVLSNVTFSQVISHSDYGGVVPGIAAKLHLGKIKSVFLNSFEKSGLKDLKEVDYIAYTSKPGLIICLQIGKVIAETIGFFLKKSIIACNHLMGHAYSSLINNEKEWNFPVIALIVSGGHTQIHQVIKHLDFKIIGNTLDDAVGECLDKVSIMMGRGYPGGPVIEKLASSGKDSYNFPFPKNDSTLDFSFSGLKSCAKRQIEKEKFVNFNDFSYSLQKTISIILSKKIINALKRTNCKTIVLGGGVIINNFLRSQIVYSIKNFSNEVEIFMPENKYCNDNAAMIGVLAYYMIKNENFSSSLSF